MNEGTTDDIGRLMPIDGEDFLFFKAFPINVALIRGTTADPDGNLTTERESLALENLALVIAARSRIWRSRSPRAIPEASSSRRSSA